MSRWHRTVWIEAVRASDLRPTVRAVAAIYADHADKRTSESWVTTGRLMSQTGLSRSSVQRARAEMVEAGWLVEVQAATNKATTVYRLTEPDDRGVTQTPPGVSHRHLKTGLGVSRRPVWGVTQTGLGCHTETQSREDLEKTYTAAPPQGRFATPRPPKGGGGAAVREVADATGLSQAEVRRRAEKEAGVMGKHPSEPEVLKSVLANVAVERRTA